MIEDWDKAIEFVLKMEGGLTDDPSDPGGLTNFGISQKSYPKLDIKNLTIEQAKAIYRENYWNACHCDELSPKFAITVFDCAVNQGVGQAIRLLQISLDVDVDGIIGSKTIAASFKATSHVKKMLAQRLTAYTRLMIDNPKLLVFAMNWFYRVLALSELVNNLS